MNSKTKQKLCWNCDGHSAVEAENCTYCGVYLNPLSIGSNQEKDNALFAPPYRLSEEDEKVVPESPFNTQTKDDKMQKQSKKVPPQPVVDNVNAIKEKTDDTQTIVKSLIMLLSGSMLLLFSLALLLFSHNGIFTLTWNANYWFLYLFISAPFLFFGWKSLKQLSE